MRTTRTAKEDVRIKWKVQFFDTQTGDNKGTFYSYAVTRKEAKRNVWLRAKKDKPQLLHLFENEHQYESRVDIDDGKGADRTISDYISKSRSTPWADKDPEQYILSGDVEFEEQERHRGSFICPNCGDDILGTDYCQKCGYDRLSPPTDPFRSANWFRRHMSKEARFAPKN